jgi:hypothetical protein
MGNGGATLQNDSYTNAAWTPVYLSFDVISPWAVGRFGNNAGADSYTANITIPDLAECKANGIGRLWSVGRDAPTFRPDRA